MYVYENIQNAKKINEMRFLSRLHIFNNLCFITITILEETCVTHKSYHSKLLYKCILYSDNDK